MSQSIRDKVLEAVEIEWFDKDHIITCCLKWMSEEQIHNMLRANDLTFPDQYVDGDEEMDEL
jgi:hypothetical protein